MSFRVIGGTARGHGLFAPPGLAVRPTASAVREALFNIVDVTGLTFLDLFAGSGAVGIEALSRGAERAVFADISRESIKTVERNLAKTRFDNKAELYLQDSFGIAAFLNKNGKIFDIIFIDPPYDIEDNRINVLLSDIVKHDIIKTNGLIITERQAAKGTRAPDTLGVDGLELTGARRYSGTYLIFMRKIN